METNQKNSDGRVDEEGAKKIELYLMQNANIVKLWAYFSQYSALMLIFSIVALMFQLPKRDYIPGLGWTLPPIMYSIFTWGHHRVLKESLEDLHIMRGIAISHTGLKLRGYDKTFIRWFQAILFILVFGTYCFSYYFGS